MRGISRLLLGPLALALAQCGGSIPVDAPAESRIEVFVHWQGEGVPGHRVEIVETGESDVTDLTGLVRFVIEPGDWTVRVYDLQGPGPAVRFVDFPVTVIEGKPARIEAVDCLLCY